MDQKTTLAAAIALALGGTGVAAAAAPTIAQCQAAATAGNQIFVGGSSAAQNAFAGALATDAFGGAANVLTYKGTAGNFRAFCGTSTNANFGAVGTVFVVHYRGEGGSVIGALPVVSQKTIKFLDIVNATTNAPTVNGTSGTVGTTDGWTGTLISHTVQIGITDVEPTMFTVASLNYPTAYNVTTFGTATPAQLGALSSTALFQQVFGLFVNTNGFNGSASTGQAVNLSKETGGQIFSGTFTDWSLVPQPDGTLTGGAVSTTAEPIIIVNRESGSGSRTSQTIYFRPAQSGPCTLGFPEATYTAATNPNGPYRSGDGFQTSDVLATAAANPGAITYASIDNAGAANLSLASLSGVVPSNSAAALGQYDDWYELTLVSNPAVTLPAVANTVLGYLKTTLVAASTTAHLPDVNALPVSPNTTVTVNPLTTSVVGGVTIYINPFTRNKQSCTNPTTVL